MNYQQNILLFISINIFLHLTIQAQDNCLDFDGIDDFVSLGDLNELDNACEFTIETWLYVKEYSHFGAIFRQRENTFASINFQSGNPSYSGSDEFMVGITTDQSSNSHGLTTGNQIPLNEWFHVALVFNGNKSTNAKRLILYKNGVPLPLTFGDSIPVRTPVINANVTLGLEGNNLNRYPFNGKMDDLRVWDFALSQERINQEMNCALQGNEDGLIAYYTFDHGVGGGSNSEDITLIDKSTNCYDGTLNNFTLSGTQSNWLTSNANVNELCNTPVDTCYESFVEIDRDLLISQINKGLILVSPNGDKWKLTVDNYGKVITTKVVICD